MKVKKSAEDSEQFKRILLPTDSCRSAIEAFLKGTGAGGSVVLAPAYIGWSPKEGSGIQDPVEQAGADLRFYRVGRDLRIDLEDLDRKLADFRPKVALFIHYFGFPDPSIEEAIAIAKAYGALTLEDEAHALFSDLIGGVCGRFADASVFSIHKMLPFASGGAIAFNASIPCEIKGRIESQIVCAAAHSPFDFDLKRIADRRVENGLELLQLLAGVPGVRPLLQAIPEGVVPQTLPVLVEGANRDRLYEEFNAAGYGGVSLYHTMIEPITADEFPDSHWLARHIFNLPVHQDMRPEQAKDMVEALQELVQR